MIIVVFLSVAVIISMLNLSHLAAEFVGAEELRSPHQPTGTELIPVVPVGCKSEGRSFLLDLQGVWLGVSPSAPTFAGASPETLPWLKDVKGRCGFSCLLGFLLDILVTILGNQMM